MQSRALISTCAPLPEWTVGRELVTLVLCRELFHGPTAVAPVTEPAHVTIGSRDDALAAMRSFLSVYVEGGGADALARLSVPLESELIEVGVQLSRDDLPRRLRPEAAVVFPCVLMPFVSGLWVSIPTLRHAFWARSRDGVEELIRTEVRRMIVAQEPKSSDYLRWLPARSHWLESLVIPIPHTDRGKHDKRVALRKAIAHQERNRLARHTLEAVALPLHDAVGKRVPHPLVGRDAELAALTSLLRGQERLGVLIVGEEQSGKTALFHAWLAGENATGRETLAYSTSGAQLIAGVSSTGQFHERVQAVLRAAEELDAILYFERLEDVLAERPETGGLALGAALRQAVDRGRVRLVAETRTDGLDALERRGAGLVEILGRVRVEPLSAGGCLEVLRRRQEAGRASGLSMDDDAMQAVIALCERYLPARAFPGKAVRLYEDVHAVLRADPAARMSGAVISSDAVYERFSLQTGIPGAILRQDTALDPATVFSVLTQSVVGQDDAVRRLAGVVGVIKARLQPSGKPLATLLFAGPTGVGKTELARALARYLFGSDDRLARFDMSEFMSADAAERLIRGTDRDDGLLTRRVREQPFCVLLLDEIEKADPGVFDLLLQVCGEGRLSDARGRTASFENAILIMTSNLGAADARTPVGFDAGAPAVHDHYTRRVESFFRPEFVNRLDRVVAFQPLAQHHVARIARLMVDAIARRRGFADGAISLNVSDRALDRLAQLAYSPDLGARPMRRRLEDTLVAPIARWLMSIPRDASGCTVEIDAVAGEAAVVSPGHDTPAQVLRLGAPEVGLVARMTQLRSASAGRQTFELEAIANYRRSCDGYMELEPVEAVRAQLESSVTELASMTAADDPRVRADRAALQAEHYRLQKLWDEAAEARRDLYDVEELAMQARLTGTAAPGLATSASAAFQRFEKVLCRLLVALEPHRDAITILAQELDGGRALDFWLAPLLETAASLGWRIRTHLLASGTPRCWDEAIEQDAARDRVLRPDRTFRSVLLRCRGPWVAIALSLEAGLHRIVLSRPGTASELPEEAYLFVRRIASRYPIPKADLGHEALMPLDVVRGNALRRGPTVRSIDLPSGEGRILRDKQLGVEPSRYWADHDVVELRHLLCFHEGDVQPDRDEVLATYER